MVVGIVTGNSSSSGSTSSSGSSRSGSSSSSSNSNSSSKRKSTSNLTSRSKCKAKQKAKERAKETSCVQGKAPANTFLSPQMLPATFVVNKDGREGCFCPMPEDADGLYVLFFNQGTPHGSKNVSTDASQLGETVMLPVLFSPENMSDAVLKAQMLRHM